MCGKYVCICLCVTVCGVFVQCMCVWYVCGVCICIYACLWHLYVCGVCLCCVVCVVYDMHVWCVGVCVGGMCGCVGVFL